MKIHVKGYKNVENLDYQIPESKLSVLLGISGSGKSAITGALQKVDVEFNKKIGYEGTIEASLDNVDTTDDIVVFNEEYINRYLFQKEKNDNVFKILIDDEGAYLKARSDLDTRLNSIHQKLNNYGTYAEELRQIQRQLGASLTKNNKLKANCTITKFKNSLSKLGSNRIYAKISSMPTGKAEWIIEGVPFIESSKCPFCGKVLSNSRKREIHLFEHVDIENHKKVNLDRQQLTKLGLSSVTLSIIGMQKLEDEAIDLGIALNEFDKLQKELNSYYDIDYDASKINLNYESQLFRFFPDLRRDVNALNKNLLRLQNNVERSLNKTKEMLSRRLNTINELIETFGIPYRIEAQYKQSKIVNYKIYHISDSQKIERENGLSQGEKKIISLILFVLEQQNAVKKLIVFDDPVSSYDENRRFSIFKYILEKLKGKTVLVLSHDQSFAKFASLDKKSSVGRVAYFDNYENFNISNIDSNDFKNINSFIMDRIVNSSNYIQKIINLRFYYELNNKGDIYRYLSRIIHKDDVIGFLGKMAQKNISEQDLLAKIKSECNLYLEPFDNSFYSNIDTSEFSLLEKIFLLRESNPGRKLKDELSNHIHLNSKLAFTLDPYKFSFCSKYIYFSVCSNIEDNFSL